MPRRALCILLLSCEAHPFLFWCFRFKALREELIRGVAEAGLLAIYVKLGIFIVLGDFWSLEIVIMAVATWNC